MTLKLLFAALLGAEAAGGGGGNGVVSPVSWANFAGFVHAGNAAVTLAVAGGAGQLVATASSVVGSASGLGYLLNGAQFYYVGPIAVHDGDTLSWTMDITPPDLVDSGTITVTDGLGDAIGSFTFKVKDPNTGNN